MLTDVALRALKSKDREYVVADHGGLCVRVSPLGKLVFFYRFRFNGKAARLSLGTYGPTSLREARGKRDAACKLLAEGIDPLLHERARQRDAEERLRTELAAETVNELIDEFLSRQIEGHRKETKEPRRMLKAYVAPRLGQCKVKDVRRRDLFQLLKGIADRGATVQANRILSLVKQMFQYAVESDLLDSNPALSIRRKSIGGEERPRAEYLSEGEIRTLWSKLDDAPGNVASKIAVRILLATGQRRGELVYAKWSSVDLQNRIWTIPADLSKNGNAHRVPLSALAMRLFIELKTHTGNSEWVLPSPSENGPMTKGALSKIVERARPVVGIEREWVLHDLRRTVRTHMSGLRDAGGRKLSRDVPELVLNHAIPGIRGVYDRNDYADEIREALDLWGARLESIAGEGQSNIAPLRRAA